MTASDPPTAVHLGVRARARAEIEAAIMASAREHLATDGAAALSLRAVARDLGMVSSNVYRYVASRDELLTRLIIEAYDALGSAVEIAEAAVDRGDRLGRWLAVCRAVRGWARAHPHQWALIYGSPVPGYVAPADTVGPATRVSRVLLALLVDVAATRGTAGRVAVDPVVADAVAPLAAQGYLDGIDADLLVRGLMARAALFGAVSLEVFGQDRNVIAEDDVATAAYADLGMTLVAHGLGIVDRD